MLKIQQHLKIQRKIASQKPRSVRPPSRVGLRSWRRLRKRESCSQRKRAELNPSVTVSLKSRFSSCLGQCFRCAKAWPNSIELAQLASRVASAMHAESANGDDPFAKVKGLISEMISRLEDKASPDTTHEAYCDKELSESRAKKEAKLAELEKLSASIDTKTTKSAQLKREVSELQTSLGELAAFQVTMTKLHAEEKDAFATNKRDLEDGIEGVRSAPGVLRDNCGGADTAHATAGESGGIIGLR